VHLVGFIIRIYHDAPSPERQKSNNNVNSEIKIYSCIFKRTCCKSKFKLHQKILKNTYTPLEQSWIPYRLVRQGSTHISYVRVLFVTPEADNSEVFVQHARTHSKTDVVLLSRCLYRSNNTLQQLIDFHKTCIHFLILKAIPYLYLFNFPRR